MFFVLSKIFWLIAAPGNFIAALAALGLVLTGLGLRRSAGWMIFTAAVLLVLGGILPTGAILIRPLEDRFPPARASGLDPTGILVLGGALDPVVTAARGTPALNSSGARLTIAAALALQYPHAQLVFSGGSAALSRDEPPEAEAARSFLESLGIDAQRIRIEDKSRNTYENAVYSRELVQPKPGERWLLVTSAFHMPRSVGIFRAVGFPVVPYPVDYTTTGTASDYRRLNAKVSDGLNQLDLAVHEWVGLVAYRLTGRIRNVFPAP